MEVNKQQNWKDMFVFYDKSNKGSISNKRIPKYLTAVGVIVSNKEIETVISKFNEEMTFNDIWNEFSGKKAIVNDDEILQAFREFDQGGVINTKDFKYILMSLGDKLTEAEADKLISYFRKDDKGDIDYVEFMNKYKA